MKRTFLLLSVTFGFILSTPSHAKPYCNSTSLWCCQHLAACACLPNANDCKVLTSDALSNNAVNSSGGYSSSSQPTKPAPSARSAN